MPMAYIGHHGQSPDWTRSPLASAGAYFAYDKTPSLTHPPGAPLEVLNGK